MKLQATLALPVLMLVLPACVPTAESAGASQTGPEPAGLCNADQLGHAIGKTLTADLEAKLKNEAKASVVRVAPHDGVITMDYSPARLNIFIDDAKKIIRINCG